MNTVVAVGWPMPENCQLSGPEGGRARVRIVLVSSSAGRVTSGPGRGAAGTSWRRHVTSRVSSRSRRQLRHGVPSLSAGSGLEAVGRRGCVCVRTTAAPPARSMVAVPSRVRYLVLLDCV